MQFSGYAGDFRKSVKADQRAIFQQINGNNSIENCRKNKNKY
jgi:hypothetical protein